MNALNHASNALFDLVLTPLEALGQEFALIMVSGIFGVLALIIFKKISSQKGIKAAKDKIKGHMIEIRIAVTRDKPNIPSIEQIWRIGDWFERETYDMFGFHFDGHRDHRRMLLPEDWEGYPLRKDYEVKETYHGIIVPKVKEGWE